jgi:hypothetical protein
MALKRSPFIADSRASVIARRGHLGNAGQNGERARVKQVRRLTE